MASSPQPAPYPIRILLIGISEGQEHWIRIALSDLRIAHTMTRFGSAVTALEELADVTDPFDFIILNVRLPALSIDEALNGLKCLHSAAAARVAVMVVDPSEVELVPPGCDVIMMPGTPDDFRRVLTRS